LDKRTFSQYEFIELVLAYEGFLTNQRLREKFDISSVQASRILASYRSTYPANVLHLTGGGRGKYAPSTKFIPAIANLGVEHYFRTVGDMAKNIEVEDVRKDFTVITPQSFRVIHSAMNTGNAAQITYRSMNHPNGIDRIVHPRAFVFAGRRWHLRAFDETTAEHRDFNLSRIFNAALSPKNVSTPVDIDWENHVHLLLQPHPKLTPDQEKLIRDELFNGAAARRVTVRRALVQYTLRELEIAVDPNIQLPPEYQLFLYRTESAQ
jgi:predicted DNA-binding transcriptional regulator YafY